MQRKGALSGFAQPGINLCLSFDYAIALDRKLALLPAVEIKINYAFVRKIRQGIACQLVAKFANKNAADGLLLSLACVMTPHESRLEH